MREGFDEVVRRRCVGYVDGLLAEGSFFVQPSVTLPLIEHVWLSAKKRGAGTPRCEQLTIESRSVCV